MSQSISDIFSRSGETVRLPVGENKSSNTKNGNFIQKLKSYDSNEEISVVDKSLTSSKSIENIPTRKDAPDNGDIAKRYKGTTAEDKAWGAIGKVMGKYKKFLGSNPAGSSLSLFGGIIRTLGTDGKVPIPPYMSKDDGQILKAALGTLKTTIGTAIGTDIPRPNYQILFRTATNSGLLNSVIKGVTNNYLGKELLKGTFPARMPSENLADTIASNFYSEAQSDSGFNFGKSIVKAVKKALLGITTDESINASDAINDLKSVQYNNRINQDYRVINDPYLAQDQPIMARNFSELFNILDKTQLHGESSNYYLPSYLDYAGFEIGSNHRWTIHLYPYPHSEGEDAFNLNRGTVTPELPYYYLPNIWNKGDNSITSSDPEPGSSTNLDSMIKNLSNNFKYKVVKGIHEKVGLSNSWEYQDTYNVLNSGRLFSFSNLPALSYDLNLGTIKTESIKLFNGSTSEIFMGMNFNATLNVSILDDVYNSMYKYMCKYINCVYDVHTGSIAPYYSAAFEIWLTIFSSTGSRITHAFKFIGIPIEFTPRLDGQQDPNECRVDITFGIIGFIDPIGKDRIADKGERLRSLDTWDQIQLHMK